ncbi:MAG: Ig-like domain repeat protein [Silvibacterium sp.]|nr:Ig-like domain repeat protein [Silvibacterium sp.]
MQQRHRFFLPGLILVVAILISQPGLLFGQNKQSGSIGLIDESALVTLKGNRHPLANAANDRGEVSPDLSMDRMLLVLRPADETALRQLIADQQDRRSAAFHAWLSPEEFAARFGPSKSDLQTLAAWLEGHGFRVNRIARSGMAIEFSGTAGEVKQAFHTPIHRYEVAGAQHIANASDPQIPAALAQVVAGVDTLHDFRKLPWIRVMGTATRIGNTSEWQPQFTYNGPAGAAHYLAPGDFSKIYNTAPLYKSGTDGSGQSIAIVGRSNIFLSDVQIFRIAFGLPANDPLIILDGPDPGDLFGGEEAEADLDVEWSGAVAPKATIKFVVSASTDTTDGVDLSAEYIVDNDLAPVMSTSFGQCEAMLGQAENAFYNNLWEQAAAEGITVIVATGDSGAAGCDYPYGAAATHGPAVSGLASTPFNVALGGTEFNENGNASAYWSSTNGTDQSSALGYIPEDVWNESCADANQCGAVSLYASGGGQSSLYAKPAWQAGPGVPDDGKRDVPDVSLAAAARHDGYLLCQEGTCATDGEGRLYNAEVIGGTSAAAPTFAGIMALVAQSAKGRVGLANFVLYPLAAAQNDANCNASGPPQASCVFNDVTQGNNNVPGQTGAAAGPGYDLATGLGSVNAANLVANWASVALRSTTTSLTLSPMSITHGQSVTATVNVVPATGSGTPTGDVAVITGGTGDLNLGNLRSGQLSSAISSLPGGSYSAVATYSGDGTFAPSTSSGVAVTVTPEPSTIAFSTSGTSVTYSEFLDLQASVTGASKQGIATGTVTIADTFNGQTTALMTAPLNSQGNLAVTDTALALGTHRLSVSYSGDPSFKASSAMPVTVTVTKGPTNTLLLAPAGALPNTAVVVQAFVFPTQGFAFPTGTVQFFDGTTALGKPVAVVNEVATLTTTQLSNGANSITAQYSGDSNFNSSTSTADSVIVANPDFQIAVNPGNVTVSSSTPGTAKILVSPGPGLGFQGSVSFACSGQPSGTTCSFQPSTLTLDGFNPQTTTLTISMGAGSTSAGAADGSHLFAARLGGLGLACVFLLGWPRRRRSHFGNMLLLAVLLGVAAGCSGGSNPPSTNTVTSSNPSTPQSYVLVVTATGTANTSTVSHTVSLAVTVQ